VSSHERRASVVETALAQDKLGRAAIAQFVLTAATPLMVLAGVVTTFLAVTGVIAVPLAFIALGLVLALFSPGYMAMARRIINAGSLYTYTAAGLGRPIGVAAAFIATASYTVLQVGLYGIFGVLASSLAEANLGVHLHWAPCAAAAWAITATLGVARVDLSGRVLTVLLTCEIIVATVIGVIGLTHPAGGHVSLQALNPRELLVPGAIGAALAIAALGFVGFEQAPVYSEEARNPRRTVPAATYGALALMIVLYAGCSWAMTVGVGPQQVVEAARQQSIELLFNIGGPVLGPAVTTAAHWLFLAGILAACISYHAAVARYGFSLGREGALPQWLARTWMRTGAPVAASLTQSLVGITVIIIFAVTQTDPLTYLFFWSGAVGGVGVLLVITITSVAIPVYFLRSGPQLEGRVRTVVIPAVAAVLLTASLVVIFDNFATLLGVPPGSRWAAIWPWSFALLAGVGLAWAAILRRTQPSVYDRIGRGATIAPAAQAATPAAAVRS
jgi:amino acid transporter